MGTIPTIGREQRSESMFLEVKINETIPRNEFSSPSADRSGPIEMRAASADLRATLPEGGLSWKAILTLLNERSLPRAEERTCVQPATSDAA
jgi:hypothetical protein